jgi:hypothetical protein
MGKNPDPGSRMNIQDHFSESLETVFWVKNLKYLNSLNRTRNLDNPGSWIQVKKIGPGINIPDPQHSFKSQSKKMNRQGDLLKMLPDKRVLWWG